MLIAVGSVGRPLQVLASRREEQMQLVRGDQPLEPRIRGPLDRCHNPPQGRTTLDITANDTALNG